MLSCAVGSSVVSRKRLPRLLAALTLPVLLSACVSGEGGMVGLAEVGTPQAVAAQGADGAPVAVPGEKPAVETAEAKGGQATVTALAPSSAVRQDGTISGSAAIDRMIEEAAAEAGVPRELAFAVVHVESRYNPKARGAGVYGLSQIKPATARSLGFSGSTEDLFDPRTNLRYGMRYLKGAWEKGGKDICQASMKYKGGHRATAMTRSAQTYCSNVKRHMAAITGRPAPSETQVVELPGVETPAAAAAIAPATRPASPAAAAIETSRVAAAVAQGAATPETGAGDAAEAVAEAAAQAAPAETQATDAAPEAEAVQEVASAFAEPDTARFGD
ncbi:lytic transglycosylase domain-containing protein [Aureimonas populi]|uniref:Lytic transglycosylase domain-containing protein n=1 Tax=Aureimonas populi TaxID=1701758 RepID=A0ABW5CJI4_9HYPH|nr:transglycosylase SLT domain-containing protein [Aureimonas populi]